MVNIFSRAISAGRRIFDWIERRLGFLKSTSRALVMKDIKTFWRDPTQWSQLIILFGVLFIYTANLRSPYFRKNPEIFFGDVWPSILSFFNMSAACFILSILTTRFVFPMLSLEGKQFWVVGLAPLSRTHIVWEKYALCWLTCFVLTESLMVFSNWILDVPNAMRWLSYVTVFLISFGLTSLAVGLGAATPNFKEDNPARIANGVGGTINVILSMVYIGLVVGLEVCPIYLRANGVLEAGALGFAIVAACVLALIVLQAVTVIVPMRIGLRRWRAIEF